jgi:hypothetical protein
MPRLVPVDSACDAGEVELPSDPRGIVTQYAPPGYKYCFAPGELTQEEASRFQAQVFGGSLLTLGLVAVAAWVLYRLFRGSE